MNKLTMLDWVIFILVAVGGLNWGLVGLFNWDLVANLFGEMSVLARAAYVLVGLGALYMLLMMNKYARK